MTKYLTRFICVLVVPFMLAGCGDGGEWEKTLTKTHFPYGNQRTAGSGVAYVLAKMMPEKSLKLEETKAETGMVKASRTIEPAVIENPVIEEVKETLSRTLRK